MKSQIKSLKSDLKSIASTISKLKSTRKSVPNGYVPEIARMQYQFRHKHIAYCLARGRTLEQIESKNRDNNKPDMKYVQWLLDAIEGKAKLYVLVRSDLSKSQQAVQAGHAVASFLKTNPNTLWSNGTLVYVKHTDLKVYGWMRYESAVFCEPDMNNEATALASFGMDADKIFAGFELI